MRSYWLGLSLLVIFFAVGCEPNNRTSAEMEKTRAKAQKAFLEFRSSMNQSLEIADQKLVSLNKKLQGASGETRKNLEKELEGIQEQRKKAQALLAKMGNSFTAHWEQMKADIQKSVTDLNEAAEAVWNKLKD